VNGPARQVSGFIAWMMHLPSFERMHTPFPFVFRRLYPASSNKSGDKPAAVSLWQQDRDTGGCASTQHCPPQRLQISSARHNQSAVKKDHIVKR
jgi:hypothetical protein